MTQEQERALAQNKNFELIPDTNRGPGWYKFKKGEYHVWRDSDLK